MTSSPAEGSPVVGPLLVENDEVEHSFAIEVDCLLQRLAVRPSGGNASDGANSNTNNNNNKNNTNNGNNARSPSNPLPPELSDARHAIHRLDSERRSYRQHALRMQRDIEGYRRDIQTLTRKAADSHQQMLRADGQLTTMRHALTAKTNQVDAVTMELMHLKRFVRALPPAYAQGYAAIEENPERTNEVFSVLQLVPDRRFQEAFDDKMSSIRFRKLYTVAKDMRERDMEESEAAAMMAEDKWEQSRRGTRAAGPTGLAGVEEMSTQALLQACGGRYAPGGAHALLDFPFNVPFAPTSPQDDYIKSLIFRSQHSEILMLLRDGLLRLSTRLKQNQDSGLRALYGEYLYCNRRSSDPNLSQSSKKGYEKQMEKLQRDHRELLFSLVNQVNHATTSLVEQEKGSDGAGGKRVRTRDVACIAMDTTVTDYRLYQAEEKMRTQRARQLENESEHAKTLAAERAKYNEMRQLTITLLQHIFAIDKAFMAVLRMSAKKKRGADKDAIFDPFEVTASRPVDAVVDDSRFTAKLAEAVDVLISSIRQFGLTNKGGGEVKFTSLPQFNNNSNNNSTNASPKHNDNTNNNNASTPSINESASKKAASTPDPHLAPATNDLSISKVNNTAAPPPKTVAFGKTTFGKKTVNSKRTSSPPSQPTGGTAPKRRYTVPAPGLPSIQKKKGRHVTVVQPADMDEDAGLGNTTTNNSINEAKAGDASLLHSSPNL